MFGKRQMIKEQTRKRETEKINKQIKAKLEEDSTTMILCIHLYPSPL